MTHEVKPGAHSGFATVVATAAVTAAIGITAAALGGYLVPSRAAESDPAAAVSQPATPRVVLVPVAPTRQPETPATSPSQPEPEVFTAAYEPTRRGDDDDDHHGSRKHSRRNHEDDHDDDD